MKEEWSPIPGFEGSYEVSDLGRVCNSRTAHVLKPQPKGGRGYTYWGVTLSVGGEQYERTIHRLVLMAFVGLPGFDQECNHIDGDRYNNRLENLEWITHRENQRWSHEVLGKQMGNAGRPGELNANSKFTETEVRKIRNLASRGLNYMEIARRLNRNHETIRSIVKRRRWAHVT